MDEGKLAIRRLGSRDQNIITVEEAISSFVAEAMPPDMRRK